MRAHRARLVHCDIKPGNMLLTEYGTAKIASCLTSKNEFFNHEWWTDGSDVNQASKTGVSTIAGVL